MLPRVVGVDRALLDEPELLCERVDGLLRALLELLPDDLVLLAELREPEDAELLREPEDALLLELVDPELLCFSTI